MSSELDPTDPEMIRVALAPSPNCPSIEQLSRLCDADHAGAAEARAAEHVAGCLRCRTELSLLKHFESGALHSDEEEDASWIEARLSRDLPRMLAGEVPPQRSGRPIGSAGWRRFVSLRTVAGGLAASGKRAWLASFAAFVMCNAYDQLRMSVAFPNLDVKVVGTHAGISIGEDGPSQMGIEDVSLACSLPNFTVVVPADDVSTEKAVFALAGVLVVEAAVTYQPAKAGGIDKALLTLRNQPFGEVLLILAAVGLIIFGIYGLCEARWRRV